MVLAPEGLYAGEMSSFRDGRIRVSPWLQAGFLWREWMVSALKIDATIEI